VPAAAWTAIEQPARSPAEPFIRFCTPAGDPTEARYRRGDPAHEGREGELPGAPRDRR
jgi:hypothetical protein